MPNMRRLQPNWLNANDDKILELLGETGVALNKRGIEVNLDLQDRPVSYSTIKRRVDKLEDSDFLEDVGTTGSYYRISDRGKRYLTGNPYGTSEITEGVDPVTLSPPDYQLLREIKEAKATVDEEAIIARITGDRQEASERLADLKRKGVITENDGLQLDFLGQFILEHFKEGKEVLSDAKNQPDTPTSAETYYDAVR